MTLSFGTKKASRGFSLTEMAIVLGVVGIILGAIWGVVSSVRESRAREETVNQVVVAVRHTREYFLSKGNIGTTANAVDASALTNFLLRQNVLLPEQIRNRGAGTLAADHPLMRETVAGGSFRICAGGAGCKASDPTQQFSVQLLGLDSANCAAMVSRLTGASGPSSLLAVHINDGSALEPPFTIEEALKGCGSSDSTDNKLEFVYRLRDRR